MFEIRPAETADYPRIVRLWHQGWHDAHAALVPAGVLAFRTIDHFASGCRRRAMPSTLLSTPNCWDSFRQRAPRSSSSMSTEMLAEAA